MCFGLLGQTLNTKPSPPTHRKRKFVIIRSFPVLGFSLHVFLQSQSHLAGTSCRIRLVITGGILPPQKVVRRLNANRINHLNSNVSNKWTDGAHCTEAKAQEKFIKIFRALTPGHLRGFLRCYYLP